MRRSYLQCVINVVSFLREVLDIYQAGILPIGPKNAFPLQVRVLPILAKKCWHVAHLMDILLQLTALRHSLSTNQQVVSTRCLSNNLTPFRDGPQTSVALSDTDAKLPCFVLPSTRPRNMFEIPSAMETLEQHFRKPDTLKKTGAEHLRALTITNDATASGKSMLTLQYADMLRAQKEVDAIFWTPHGNVADVRSQTFGTMVVHLCLPGAKPGDFKTNGSLFLNLVIKYG